MTKRKVLHLKGSLLVTLPAKICKELEILKGSDVAFEVDGQGRLILIPVKNGQEKNV